VTQPFTVSGWAIDLLGRLTGESGIDAVQAYAFPATGDPIFLGTAGRTNRPDIAARFGPSFLASGWSLPVSGLPSGRYTLAVFARRNGQSQFLPAVTRPIAVAPGGAATCTYRIDPASSQVDHLAGTASASIVTAAGCEFTVSSTNGWLRTAAAGTLRGPVHIDYVFDAYLSGFSGETRQASVLVTPAVQGVGARLSVEQLPDCHIGLTMRSVPAAGGSVGINVIADPVWSCPWRVLSTAPWLTIPGSIHQGDGGFIMTATPNTSGVDRTTTITVGGDPFVVTQLGQ
jgi:hypothetical protein